MRNRARIRRRIEGGPKFFDWASLDLRFDEDRYFVGGTTYSDIAFLNTAVGATFTRASAGWAFDASGVLWQFASGAPRRTSAGLLIEEGRTNTIRNNSMVGAVAGTPGTLPTNWRTSGPAGISSAVVGTGAENGLPYIDVRFSGTAGSTSTCAIGYEAYASTATAATVGQVWTSSVHWKLIANAATLYGNSAIVFDEFNSSGTYLTGEQTVATPVPGASLQRASLTRTLANAATARLTTEVRFTVTNGVAYDFTIRIAAPQLELGAFATSPILTTGSALARAADVYHMPTAAGWYAQGPGTLYAAGAYDQAIPRVAPRYLAALSDTTANNRLFNFAGDNASSIAARVTVGGVSTNPGDIAFTRNAGQPFKQAITAEATTNGAISAVQGTLSTAATPGSMPLLTRLNIGTSLANGEPAGGVITRVAYGNARLANADLQAITA